jgi:hypothetical protein
MGVPSARPYIGFEETAKYYSGVSIVPSSNDFPKRNLIAHPCAEAPLCEAQSFPSMERTECANTMRTRKSGSIFLGTGFRFSETDFLKKIFGFGFRPAGGVWGGMRGGFFFGFLAGRANRKAVPNFGTAFEF